jgi:hypothetical protein
VHIEPCRTKIPSYDDKCPFQPVNHKLGSVMFLFKEEFTPSVCATMCTKLKLNQFVDPLHTEESALENTHMSMSQIHSFVPLHVAVARPLIQTRSPSPFTKPQAL